MDLRPLLIVARHTGTSDSSTSKVKSSLTSVCLMPSPFSPGEMDSALSGRVRGSGTCVQEATFHQRKVVEGC